MIPTGRETSTCARELSNEPANELANEPVNVLANEPANVPANKAANESANEPADNQPIKQPDLQRVAHLSESRANFLQIEQLLGHNEKCAILLLEF